MFQSRYYKLMVPSIYFAKKKSTTAHLADSSKKITRQKNDRRMKERREQEERVCILEKLGVGGEEFKR